MRDVRRALCAAFAAMRAQADASGNRDVYHDLATEASCRTLLRTLVTRPVLPETLRGAASVAGSSRSSAKAESSRDQVQPLRVLTWNVSQTDVNPVSARAPLDRHVWSIEENLAAVQAYVLQQRPDVVALQECPASSALAKLSVEFDLLGASRSHCGFVHLYTRRELDTKPVDLGKDVHGVMAVVRAGAESLAVVAVHLAPGSDSAPRRNEQVHAVIKAKPEAERPLVVLGDMNVRDEELQALRDRFSLGGGCVSWTFLGPEGKQIFA